MLKTQSAPPLSEEKGGAGGRWAVAVGLATFAAYMVGAGRAFGYDAAVTMDRFVAGPPSWALTRQTAFNNHPLFSLLEGFVADVAGTGEVVMRVLPAAFAAAAVGLLVWRLGERWGTVAGVVGGLTLAVHPMLVPLARDARGYSLAVLAIVVMGLAVLERPWLFAVALAVGVGTHLYVLVPFAALVAWMIAGGVFDRRWRIASAAGAAGGLAVYLGMEMGTPGRTFRPAFPLDAGWAFLGGGLVAAVSFVLVLTVASRSVIVDRRWLAMGGVMALGVVGPWLVGPPDLYPRFVYWALPGLAVAVAYAVHREPRVLPVVVVALVACLVPQLDDWTDDELPNRVLAEHVQVDTCWVTWTAEALRWYAPLSDGDDCATVALLAPDRTPKETALVRERWPVACWSTDGAEVRGSDYAACRAITS